jgi:hypothetical protein
MSPATYRNPTWPLSTAALSDMTRLLGLLFRPGEVIELRVTETPNIQDSARSNLVANGYFNDPRKLTGAIQQYPGKFGPLSFTVNPVRRSLLQAANNDWRRPAQWTVTDDDITRRSNLLIRFTSEDQDQHQAAQGQAEECHRFLHAHDWPDAIEADSGTSIDLLYAIDLPNCEENTELVRQTLTALAERFDRLDTSVFRAALMCPLYGIDGSSILSFPAQLQLVGSALLSSLIELPVDGIHPLSVRQETVDVNHFDAFVQTKCEQDPKAWTPTGILYNAYLIYCDECGLPEIIVPHFARKLVTQFGLEAHRRKVNGRVTRGISGIQLKVVR